MNWKNIFERAAWTFGQGFVGTLLVAPALDLSILAAGALGGLMAVLSFAKTIIQEKLEKLP